MNAFFRDLEERGKVLVFGHRGFSQEYPENTMLSFSQCAGNPLIDGVELDVHMCRSGEVVVAHDFSLKRTAGIDREIEEFSYDELRGIDVGSFKGPQFSDARIPLLSDLFTAFGNRFLYDIELKVKAGKVNSAMSRKVIDLISDFKLWPNVVVSSFNPIALGAFRRECRLHGKVSAPPTADIFAHSADIPRVLWNGAGHIVSRSSYQKPESLQVDERYLGSHGLPVITWTVNTEAEALRLLDLNRSSMRIFGMIGNDPHMLAGVVSRYTH